MNPLTTTLYRYYDAEDRLLYVGISTSAVLRMVQHKTTADWWSLTRSARFEVFQTRREALAAEREAIQAERPLFNRTGVLPDPAIAAEARRRATQARWDARRKRREAKLAEHRREVKERWARRRRVIENRPERITKAIHSAGGAGETLARAARELAHARGPWWDYYMSNHPLVSDADWYRVTGSLHPEDRALVSALTEALESEKRKNAAPATRPWLELARNPSDPERLARHQAEEDWWWEALNPPSDE